MDLLPLRMAWTTYAAWARYAVSRALPTLPSTFCPTPPRPPRLDTQGRRDLHVPLITNAERTRQDGTLLPSGRYWVGMYDALALHPSQFCVLLCGLRARLCVVTASRHAAYRRRLSFQALQNRVLWIWACHLLFVDVYHIWTACSWALWRGRRQSAVCSLPAPHAGLRAARFGRACSSLP
jgi:hypothetical protein